ncbi:LD-carboxypeptidase, partial [Staphylococcus felis]
GNESARIIPYLNETTIRENPKIFIGYSDITALHLYFNTLGLVTFYGPALLTDFAENVALDRYTLDYLFRLIGDVRALGYIETSPYTRRFGLRWEESLKDIEREKTLNSNYVLIQGNQPASGPLIGGCFESLDKLRGTPYFPDINEFNDKILFIETSEVITEPWSFEETMRSFGYMGIFHRINGMVIGRPQNGT